jgi:hypothetical protein
VPVLNAALDRTVEAFEPWSTGVHYLNFADRPSDGSKGFDAQAWSRLLDVKKSVDPNGLFLAAHPVV